MPQKKKKNQKKAPPGSKKRRQSSRSSSGGRKGSAAASSRYRIPFIIAVAIIVVILIALFSDRFSDWRTEQAREADSDKIASIIDKLPPPVVDTRKPELTLPPAHRIAIVIDDMGQGLQKINAIIEMDSQVTVSILPYLSHSAEVAELANSNGLEVLLHVPMEPHNMKLHNPGDGILHTLMTEDEVRSMLVKDLEEVPHITGMNNHMGSKFTEDRRVMKTVIEVAAERGLYFLDSKTTNASVASDIAKSLGVKNVSRNIFLDNNRDEEYIKGQLEKVIRIAKKRGFAIAIGHPYPETIAVLKKALPSIEERGVRVVRLSELVK